MLCLALADAAERLLRDRSVVLQSDQYRKLSFHEGSGRSFRVDVPANASRAISLAYVIVMSDVATDDEPDFIGSSLWLEDWNIWGEASDRVGVHLLEALRQQSGSSDSPRDTPVMVFGTAELSVAHSLLTLCLLFQWDAQYLAGSKRFCASVDHDGFIEIVATSDSMHRALFERFSRGGWSPYPKP